MTELIRSDDGAIGKGLAIGVGIVAVTGVTAGVLIANNFFDMFSGDSPDADASRLLAVQEAIALIDDRDVVSGVYNVGGSSAHLDTTIAGEVIPVLGTGVVMTEGKVIRTTSIQGEGIRTDEIVENGEAVQVVSIDRDAIRYSVQFHDADTTIVPSDEPLSQAKKGAVDFLTGSGRAICETAENFLGDFEVPLPFGDGTFGCDDINFYANAQNIDRQKLERTFRVEVLKFVQEDCGSAGWSVESIAIEDSFKQQVQASGGDPDLVRMQIVDDSGKPTSEPPEFSNTTLQVYYDQGVLSEEVDGAVELQFDTEQCTPMSVEEYVEQQENTR